MIAAFASLTSLILLISIAPTASGLSLEGALGLDPDAKDLALSGKRVYLASGEGGLQIVDVSDSRFPTLLGSVITGGDAHSICVTGDLAYLADGANGLVVLDVGHDVAPEILGTTTTDGEAVDVVVAGGLAFVLDLETGLHIFDVTLPSSVSAIAHLEFAGGGDQELFGDHLFVAGSDGDVRLIDISNPAAPEVLLDVETPGIAAGVEISGDYAYVADSDSGVQVIDIANLSAPRIVASVSTPSVASNVCVFGDDLYVAGGASGLLIVDITQPTRPELIETASPPGSTSAVLASGEFGFVVGEGCGLQIVRVWNPVVPARLGRTELIGHPHDLTVVGDLAFATGEFGLAIFDVSTSSNPFLVSTTPTRTHPDGICIDGDYAYLGDVEDDLDSWIGVHCIDISDPKSPVIVASLETGREAEGIVVDGNYAYLAAGDVQVLDITDPRRPALIGALELPEGYATDISVQGDIAYVFQLPGRRTAFHAIDISRPEELRIMGTLALAGTGRIRFEVEGDFVYVSGSGWGGIGVIDVSDPTHPQKRGYANAGSGSNDIAVEGNVAYVSTGLYGIVTVDISDPDNPVPTRALRFNSSDVFVAGSTAYDLGLLGYAEEGVTTTLRTHRIAERSFADLDPPRQTTVSVLPNPFHTETVIAFDVPVPVRTRVAIYDSAGRSVKVLRDDVLAAGRYSVEWDGRSDAGHSLGSGVYWARIESQGSAGSTSVLLVR